MNSECISIVLVEPQSPGNIGMVCRAMKNMGLRELRLVRPCRIDHLDAIKFAVSARDVLEKAVEFPTLADALADCAVSVATTRRHGKYRQEIMTPEEVATKLKLLGMEQQIAIVFGREDSGLTTEELSLCTLQATIPTGDPFGSLNLAQAVLIFCYELCKAEGGEIPKQQRTLTDSREMEELYGHMERTLLRIGFLNPENPAHLMRTLRRVFARAELDPREVAVLRGMMSQIDWAAGEFKGKKGT